MRPLSNKQRTFLLKIKESDKLTHYRNMMIGNILNTNSYDSQSQANELNKIGKLFI